jgi:hypothetical protein
MLRCIQDTLPFGFTGYEDNTYLIKKGDIIRKYRRYVDDTYMVWVINTHYYPIYSFVSMDISELRNDKLNQLGC